MADYEGLAEAISSPDYNTAVYEELVEPLKPEEKSSENALYVQRYAPLHGDGAPFA